MKKMNLLKKSSMLAFGLSAIMALSSCSKEQGCIDPNALNYDPDADEDCCCAYASDNDNNSENVVITSNITSNTNWSSDNVYVLAGRIAVESGATLTIEAGTIVKGEAGTGINATALLVARGAKLMAEGTASKPIIFTSVADEISPDDIARGDFASPNLDPEINGYWGGLIVLGNAPISASSPEIQIEGIPTSDPNGLYGGNDPADNSGVIKYISIRHGGSNIGAGNEINGLTLGGVGSGTVIENVEVVANQDDGIEWFGGTVNVTNAVVWNAGDDAIDTDQAWSGTLDNFVVIYAGNHLFELDGPEGAFMGASPHTLKNGTIIASDLTNEIYSDNLFNLDPVGSNASRVHLENIHFMSVASTADRPSQVINRINNIPDVTFTNITIDVPAADLYLHVNEASSNAEVPAGITAGGTPQANVGVLGWTWASQAGMLSGL